MGSILTNKYAEGYPGKRYYGGCQFVDEAETLAIERLKQLFGAAWANVQPHSGSQANTAVFHAFLKPGDNLTLTLNPKEFDESIDEHFDFLNGFAENEEDFKNCTDEEIKAYVEESININEYLCVTN